MTGDNPHLYLYLRQLKQEAFLPAATLGAVRSTGAKVWLVGVRPLLVQPYIIFACMVFCGYLDIWTADVNFGKMII